MKKTIALLVLAAMSLSGFACTPKTTEQAQRVPKKAKTQS